MVGKGTDDTLERVLLTCMAFPNCMPDMLFVPGFGIELTIGLGEVSMGVGREPVGSKGWSRTTELHDYKYYVFILTQFNLWTTDPR